MSLFLKCVWPGNSFRMQETGSSQYCNKQYMYCAYQSAPMFTCTKCCLPVVAVSHCGSFLPHSSSRLCVCALCVFVFPEPGSSISRHWLSVCCTRPIAATQLTRASTLLFVRYFVSLCSLLSAKTECFSLHSTLTAWKSFFPPWYLILLYSHSCGVELLSWTLSQNSTLLFFVFALCLLRNGTSLSG